MRGEPQPAPTCGLAFDKLDQHQLGGIAQAMPQTQDARIPAAALSEARRDLIEQALDRLRIAQARSRDAARMNHRAGLGLGVLGPRDQLFHLAANGLRLGARGANTVVQDELVDEGLTQRRALAARPSQFLPGYLVSHALLRCAWRSAFYTTYEALL